MSFIGVVLNDGRLGLQFQAKANVIPGQVAKATAHAAQVIKGSILSFASGRPGPNEVTGKYKGSWGVKLRFAGPAADAEIGTNEPYGFRLEKGYHETDSLGREYDQPPFPHVEPGIGAAIPTVMIVLGTVADFDNA